MKCQVTYWVLQLSVLFIRKMRMFRKMQIKDSHFAKKSKKKENIIIKKTIYKNK